MKLKENERIDDLEYKGLKIIQKKDGFCFGMDSVLLSDFAKNIKNNSVVADLGTGTGIISILLSKKTLAKKIIGVEIQEEVAEMAKRSVQLNNLESKIEIVNEDIKNLDKIFERNSIDVIVTNPPYKKDKTGILNDNISKTISRHEVKCTLQDIINQAVFLLKDKGELYMVHRPDRLVDILYELRKNKIEPKLIRFVSSKKGEVPNLVLIKAIKNARQLLLIKEPLYIYEENGNYNKEILKIYNKE